MVAARRGYLAAHHCHAHHLHSCRAAAVATISMNLNHAPLTAHDHASSATDYGVYLRSSTAL
jgi:hypothetical protein